MENDNTYIAGLLYKFLNESLTAEESKILKDWELSSHDHEYLINEIVSEEQLSEALSEFHPENRQILRNRLLDLVNKRLVQNKEDEGDSSDKLTPEVDLSSLTEVDSPSKIRRMPQIPRWWAAASVIVFITVGVCLWIFNQNRSNKNHLELLVQKEIQPGREGAILTLADGSQVVLDSLGNGVIAHQTGSQVIIKNGELIYHSTDLAVSQPAYNIMTTPRGRQFTLMLPDGTRVWLNAASSIRYPTVFTGNERRVEITGEAYFEVSSLPLSGGKKMPFIVSKGDIQVEVLGTHFNVNAYEDEADVKVTLLEGSVRTSIGLSTGSGGESSILKPGEQAVIRDRIKVVKGVDADEVMAWKNGLFNFKGAGLQEVMRQLERWYNIEVVYQGKISRTYRFAGELERDLQLSQVLRILERMDVQFKLEGRKLIVMQQ